MVRRDVPIRGDVGLAFVFGNRATGVENAARRRVLRAGDVSFDHDALALCLHVRVRHGDCGKERFRVGVQRLVVEVVSRRQLHEFAKIHHADAR